MEKANRPPNPLLEAALDYASRGWPVFPCHTPTKHGCSCGKGKNCDNIGKHPRYRKEDLPHGVHGATTDPDLIRRWWKRWPQANVAVATGGRSFEVLDCDVKEALSGLETLADLQLKHGGPLPETLSQKTGGGGRQYFYKPSGKVKNAVGFAAGLDVRSEGGYVLVPPSLHRSGRRYEWLNDAPLAEWPPWLLAEIGKGQSAAKPGDAPRVDPIEILAGVPEGERDQRLFAYACRLRVKGFERHEAEVLILAAAARCRPPFPEKDALRKLDQAWRYSPRMTSHAGAADSPKRTFLADGNHAHLETTRQFSLSDLGNAERMAFQHRKNLRRCYLLKNFFHWNGRFWEEDTSGEAARMAKDTVRSIFVEAANETDGDRRKGLVKHAFRSEAADRIQAMLHLLQSEPGIPIAPGAFDRDPFLLNALNGTIDLRSGVLLPHTREHFITKCAGTIYDPAAICPLFLKFLRRIMGDDDVMVAFLQRLFGMMLTGDVSEQVFTFLWGCGMNGKSTLLETLRALLNAYARHTSFETFLSKNNDNARHDLARLKGARFVTAIEPEADGRLAESVIKQIAGCDTITARLLYRDAFEYKPEFKVVVATNHRVTVWGTDPAIWRRILLVEFTVRIPDEEQDRRLPDKLISELPGILAWLVKGCLSWQRDGLNPPKKVLAATERYREEQDALAGFLASCCVKEPGAQVTAKALYERYNPKDGSEDGWCQANSEKAFSKRTFGQKLAERGFFSGREGDGTRVWYGLRLLNPGEKPPDSSQAPSDASTHSKSCVETYVGPERPENTGVSGSADASQVTPPNFLYTRSRVALVQENCVECVDASKPAPALDSDSDATLPLESVASDETERCAGCPARADRPGFEGLWCHGAAFFEGKSGKPLQITEKLAAGCPHSPDRKEGHTS